MVWGRRHKRVRGCSLLEDVEPQRSPSQVARCVGALGRTVALPGVWGISTLLRWSGSSLAKLTTFMTAAGTCAFLPPAAAYSLAGLVLMSTSRARQLLPLTRHVSPLLNPLQPFQRTVMVLGAMRLLLPVTLPAVWRATQYWQRMLPIAASYIRASIRAQQLSKAGNQEAAQQLWAHQHEWGAQQMFNMLADIKGFYLKLGQILATKTEMLPAPYTNALAGLLDSLAPEPFTRIQDTLSKELGRPLDEVYSQIDPFPLASATIAQVHAGQLAYGDCQRVAIKVQHRKVKSMMHADLANMRLGVDLCDRLGIDLGFDLGSVVREYQVAVPAEFDHLAEAACMSAIKHSLERRAHMDLPLLSRVMVPEVHMNLCSEKVLVMDLLQGVPLLHIAGMQPQLKSQLMHALVLAFGVQVLCDGLFHTDPHPGNLMACMDPDSGLMKVGLLDFGQVRRLTVEERLRVAQLVIAIASRDGDTVRSTCRNLGVQIEKCDAEFEEIAAYILFDTRMDIPEALQSPADPLAHEGWRTTRVPKLPRDLFMVMRVITLLRGVMASLSVHDVSSALIWQPLAAQAVADLQASDALVKQVKADTRDEATWSVPAHATPSIASASRTGQPTHVAAAHTSVPQQVSCLTDDLDLGDEVLIEDD